MLIFIALKAMFFLVYIKIYFNTLRHLKNIFIFLPLKSSKKYAQGFRLSSGLSTIEHIQHVYHYSFCWANLRYAQASIWAGMWLVIWYLLLVLCNPSCVKGWTSIYRGSILLKDVLKIALEQQRAQPCSTLCSMAIMSNMMLNTTSHYQKHWDAQDIRWARAFACAWARAKPLSILLCKIITYIYYP